MTGRVVITQDGAEFTMLATIDGEVIRCVAGIPSLDEARSRANVWTRLLDCHVIVCVDDDEPSEAGLERIAERVGVPFWMQV